MKMQCLINRNLGLVFLDNGAYGSTGGQASLAAGDGLRLDWVVRACGLCRCVRVDSLEALQRSLRARTSSPRGPWRVVARVEADTCEGEGPDPFTGWVLALRLRAFLTGGTGPCPGKGKPCEGS